MNNGAMANINIFLNVSRSVGLGMYNTVFLHVGPITNYYSAIIPAQDSAGTNKTLCPNNHMTN
jgi:hypothetical protein